MDGFTPEHLPTSQLELDIGITAACKQKGCQFKQKNATVSGKRGITSPPLSRTARLCPLFSSISSLYIPEPCTDRSGGTAEEHEAPTACQQKSRDYCQTASKRKSVTPSERKPVFQSKLSHISQGNKKKSFSKQRPKLILHPLSFICSRKMTRAD